MDSDNVFRPGPPKEASIADRITQRGITRREFLGFCGILAAAFALPASATEVIAAALETQPRKPVIWLEFQDCTGDSESFLRSYQRADPLIPSETDPKITDLVLDTLSIIYHETLMAPSGANAEKSRTDAIRAYAGQYILVVEGSIPVGSQAYYCMIGGKTAQSILQEAASSAAMTIAFGSCAFDGGLSSARPAFTNGKGVKDAATGVRNLVNIPGCPANGMNLVTTILYALVYNQIPPLDSYRRPTFAYGRTVHNQCFRRERGEVKQWGDASHRNGGCLEELGCRGPDTYSNCPSGLWNSFPLNDSSPDTYTCWPIKAGHHCIGCTNPKFWDQGPFYSEAD